MSKKIKLTLLSNVQARLVVPGAAAPASRNSLYLYLKKLGIKPVLQKVGETGWPVAHITEEEAEAVLQDFKRTHWRKFKAVEEVK